MSVKSSGSLSLGIDIPNEFGGSAPHSLSEYVRSGPNVPNITANNKIKTSQSNMSIGDYYSGVKQTAQNSVSATAFSINDTYNADNDHFGGDIPKNSTYYTRNSDISQYYTTPNIPGPVVNITTVNVEIGAGGYRYSDKWGGWDRYDYIAYPGIRVYRASDNVVVASTASTTVKRGESPGDGRAASHSSNRVVANIPALSFTAAQNTQYYLKYYVQMRTDNHKGDAAPGDFLWVNQNTPTISTILV